MYVMDLEFSSHSALHRAVCSSSSVIYASSNIALIAFFTLLIIASKTPPKCMHNFY